VEKIIIQKNYMLKHFKIDINYQGYGVRDNNVERILDSFFYEFKDQTIELDYLISVIRKILDNYDENFLNIILVYKNSNNYEVSYVDKELSKYESFQELVLLNEYDYVGLIVRFDEYGINFSLTNNAGMILDSKIIEIINKELSKTVLLNNPKLLDFSYEDILLTKVYMLFYNENPDFSLEEVRIKTQCMLSILKFFNIIMNVHVNFHFDSKINIPVSSDVNRMINNIIPFGKINKINEDANIIPILVSKIKEIGLNIKEINSSIEFLKKMSMFAYVNNYDYENAISRFTQSNDDVMLLLRKTSSIRERKVCDN